MLPTAQAPRESALSNAKGLDYTQKVAAFPTSGAFDLNPTFPMPAATACPQPISDVDLRTLPIGPTEAFVLSRVDGATTVADLAMGTGLQGGEVETILLRLVELGAIRYDQVPDPSPASPANRAETTTSGSSSSVRIRISDADTSEADTVRPIPREEPTTSRPPASAQKVHDPALLAEAPDVALETKQAILDLYDAIDASDHYSILGIERDADKKAVKAAYFELVNVFHSDRFFGKELGSFKAKVDRIFATLTKAHDTLTRKRTRTDYDAYLQSLDETREARETMPPRRTGSSQRRAIIEEVGPRIPRAPKTPEVDTSSTDSRSANTTAGDKGDRRSPTSLTSSLSPTGRGPAIDAAKRAMARRLKGKLGASLQPPASASSDPPPVSNDEKRKAIRDDLKARLDARASIPAAGPRKYVALADEAEKNQQWPSVVNALKMALSYEADAPELQERLKQAELETDRALASKFADQGKYEERDREYARAARSYERAARGKESAELYHRAADCLLRAQGDARKAVELARLAVQLDGSHVAHRTSLAEAYVAGGMVKSALKELERALELEPKNDHVKAMYKDFKKNAAATAADE